MSAIKITEKATALLLPIATPCICMKCLSLNLKEFSWSISFKSSPNYLWELANYAHCAFHNDGK